MEKIISQILSHFSDEKEKSLITKALDFASAAHQNQKRKSGEPYIYHPLKTALVLAEMNLDATTVAAGILHDTIEDTPRTLAEIKNQFGEEIAFLVDGVTNLGRVRLKNQSAKIENLRKMFLATAKDIRVILIRLADRLHNMETLGALPEEKRKRISLETLEVYAPIAHRLGIGEIKGRLEDLSFLHLYPKEYQWLISAVASQYEAKKKYLKEFEPILKEILIKENIKDVQVNTRVKHLWSLYNKFKKYEMNWDQIYDLVAARVVVPTVENCYGVLGAIHKHWRPLPGRIKDYIALPKPNGYQSLHTTVFGPKGEITEIQIRTPQMHARAENGIAAHWAYKERQGVKTQELTWIDQLREWQKEVRGSDEFFESLRIDFFKDRIFVLTPKGDVINLPEGATPVDFAYQLHTDIGRQCSGAKVNNKIVSLNTPLQSGDLVEILRQKNKKPSRDWLSFVKTHLAREKIKAEIKKKNLAFRPLPKTTELKIKARDRIGLIKDISGKIAAQKINIIAISSTDKSKFPLINISLNIKEKSRLDRLLIELKKIKDVQEISYK